MADESPGLTAREWLELAVAAVSGALAIWQAQGTLTVLLTCVALFCLIAFGGPRLTAWRRERATRREHALQAERERTARESWEDELRSREQLLTRCLLPECPLGRVPAWYTDWMCNRETGEEGPVCWSCIGGYEPPVEGETKNDWIERMQAHGLQVPDGWETSPYSQERWCVVCERRVPMVYARKRKLPVKKFSDGRPPKDWVCLDCIEGGILERGARRNYYKESP